MRHQPHPIELALAAGLVTLQALRLLLVALVALVLTVAGYRPSKAPQQPTATPAPAPAPKRPRKAPAVVAAPKASPAAPKPRKRASKAKQATPTHTEQ